MVERIMRKFRASTTVPANQEYLILNEAVHFEKQCIFIAVPKTGTTSVRSQLRQHGNPLIGNPHLNILQVRDSLYVYFLKQALGENRSYPSVSVPTDAEVRNKANTLFERFFKFSAVRNPWARAASLYSRREGVKTKERLSFEAFCTDHLYASDTCRHPTLHHNQTDWLSDENGQIIMDYVYRLENFDQAISEIAERTDGRVQLEGKNANRNADSDSRSYRDLYTDKSRRLIATRFEKDIDTFKYTF